MSKPEAVQRHVTMGMLERLYLRVFGLPSTVKQQQAREVFGFLRHLQFNSVLDFGCAHGYYSVRIARQCPVCSVFGIELDCAELKVAKSLKARFHLQNVDFGNVDISGLRGKFDVVLLLQVIEHLPDDLATLKQIHALMTKGGYLIITGPNLESPLTEWNKRHIQVDSHVRDGYTLSEVARLLKRAGFTVTQLRYISKDLGILLSLLSWD